MDPTRFQTLDDIQLAILLSLVARNHCLITTDEEYLQQLQNQIEKSATDEFGLSTSAVTCSKDLTLDEFISETFVPAQSSSGARDLWGTKPASSSSKPQETPTIPNVIIARNLELTSDQVQTQVLDLIRHRAITTKSQTHNTPDPFLLIALIPKSQTKPPLNPHLLDFFFISHYHDPHDDEEDSNSNYPASSSHPSTKSTASLSSIIIHKSPPIPLFTPQDLATLTNLSTTAHVSAELKRYLHDIIVFLRMHRAVAGGISAKATKDFELAVKCLCPLNGLEFATPSLAELAVYKVYSHRIDVADKKTDRSVMWGSRPEAVEKYLAQVDAGMIIDDVLEEVRAPL